MQRWWMLLPFLTLLAGPARAGDDLDVRDWLARPGVKMLAVEFYASWCGPCKKAVPRWRALHEEYRDRGLRLVVVSVQDPDGTCVNPGWNPDDIVCDTEGWLADAWKVGDKLPAAFLWSWRGGLLVRRGHVGAVEDAVEAELTRLPRLTLDEGMDPDVRDLLRAELARTGKVDVVAGAAEQEALAALRRQSRELQFAKGSACRLGERLAPNSLLKAAFVPVGAGRRFLVQLFSAETGCLSASAGVYWNEGKPDQSVAEAVAELVEQLREDVESPGLPPPASGPEPPPTVQPEPAAEPEPDPFPAIAIMPPALVGLPSQAESPVGGPSRGDSLVGGPSRADSPVGGPPRSRLFHLGLSLAEGALFAGGATTRTGVAGTLSTWLKWGWFRWEPASIGLNFEGANAVTLATGAAWDLVAGLYLRTLFEVALADGASYWGFLTGVGYGFDLGRGWRLDLELDASFWPGAVVGVPVEGRLGVRYGF